MSKDKEARGALSPIKRKKKARDSVTVFPKGDNVMVKRDRGKQCARVERQERAEWQLTDTRREESKETKSNFLCGVHLADDIRRVYASRPSAANSSCEATAARHTGVFIVGVI